MSKKIRKLLISDKTFTDIMSGKINYISHEPTHKWRPLVNEESVIFVAYYGQQKQRFRIIKIEKTIIKTIKIYVKKYEDTETRAALHNK